MRLVKVTGAVVLAVLLALLAVMPAGAGDCMVRSRGNCYSATYYTPYYAPSYYPSYNYYPQYVVKTVEVPTAPSYYYDSSQAYRDNLLADAIAYRVLSMRGNGFGVGGQQVVPQQQEGAAKGAEGAPAANKPAPAATPGVRTEVDPKVQKAVTDSCVKCHNASVHKAGVDLSDLATTPVGMRWAAHGMVSAGLMPQGEDGKPKPLPDADVEPFFQWARSASKTAGK